jgi:hypothetical protein
LEKGLKNQTLQLRLIWQPLIGIKVFDLDISQPVAIDKKKQRVCLCAVQKLAHTFDRKTSDKINVVSYEVARVCLFLSADRPEWSLTHFCCVRMYCAQKATKVAVPGYQRRATAAISLSAPQFFIPPAILVRARDEFPAAGGEHRRAYSAVCEAKSAPRKTCERL